MVPLEPEVFVAGLLLFCFVTLPLPFLTGSDFEGVLSTLLLLLVVILLGVAFLDLLVFCFGSGLAGISFAVELLLLIFLSANCFAFLVVLAAGFTLAVCVLTRVLSVPDESVLLLATLFVGRDGVWGTGIIKGGTVGCRESALLTLLPGSCFVSVTAFGNWLPFCTNELAVEDVSEVLLVVVVDEKVPGDEPFVEPLLGGLLARFVDTGVDMRLGRSGAFLPL